MAQTAASLAGEISAGSRQSDFAFLLQGLPAGFVDYHGTVLPDATRAFHQFQFREVLGGVDIRVDSFGIRALRRERHF